MGNPTGVADRVAAGLTYRPGWTFEALGDVVRLTFTGPNSFPTASDETITLSVDTDVRGCSLRQALQRLEERIAGIEAHERAEWLRFDGLCVSPEANRAHPGMYWHL